MIRRASERPGDSAARTDSRRRFSADDPVSHSRRSLSRTRERSDSGSLKSDRINSQHEVHRPQLNRHSQMNRSRMKDIRTSVSQSSHLNGSISERREKGNIPSHKSASSSGLSEWERLGPVLNDSLSESSGVEVQSKHSLADTIVSDGEQVSAHLKIKKWINFRDQSTFIYLDHEKEKKIEKSKKKAGLVLAFDEISNPKLPSILANGPRDHGSDPKHYQYCLYVSLFHTISRTFFGNTWISSLMNESNSGNILQASSLSLLSQYVKLYTRISDANCVMVVELVVVEKSSSGLDILGQYGCGWTYLPVFEMSANLSGKGTRRKAQLFSGSPRALLFLPLNSESHSSHNQANGLQPMEDCMLSFMLARDKTVLNIRHLIRENELVGPGDIIHGLKPRNGIVGLPVDPKTSIRLLPEINLFADHISLLLPSNWEDHLLESFQKKHDMRSALVRGGAFTLDIGAHNGRTIVSKGGLISCPLRRLDYGESSEFDTRLIFDKSIRLKGLPAGKGICLIFELKYNLSVERKRLSFCVGCGFWLPFDERRPGKTIALSNVSSKKGLLKSPLQLELVTNIKFPFTGALLLEPLQESVRVAPVLALSLRTKPKHSTSGLKRRDHGDTKVHNRKASRELSQKAIVVKPEYSSTTSYSDSELGEEEKYEPDNKSKSSLLMTENPNENLGEENFDVDNLREVADWTQNSILESSLTTSALYKNNAKFAEPLHLNSEKMPETKEPAFRVLNLNDPLLNKTLNLPVTKRSASQDSFSAGLRPFVTNEYNPETAPVDSLRNTLSRVSRTSLRMHGFTDDTTICNGKSRHKGTIQSVLKEELRDHLKVNDISVQFAAYRHSPSDVSTRRPNAIFFTYQFYTCLPICTEKMILYSAEHQKLQLEAPLKPSTFLLMKAAGKNDKCLVPSQALRHTIDSSNVSDKRRCDFFRYLYDKCLFVDVWDSESLLLIGTLAIHLYDLLRRGDRLMRVAQEYDIVKSYINVDASGMQKICVYPNNPGRGEIVGKVQVILSNRGLEGSGRTEESFANLSIPRGPSVKQKLPHDLYNFDPKMSTSTASFSRVVARRIKENYPSITNLSVTGLVDDQREELKQDAPNLRSAVRANNGAASTTLLTDMEMSRLFSVLDPKSNGFVSLGVLCEFIGLPETFSGSEDFWKVFRLESKLCNPKIYQEFALKDLEYSGFVSVEDFDGILADKCDPKSMQMIQSSVELLRDRNFNKIDYEKFLLGILGDPVLDFESKLRRKLLSTISSSSTNLTTLLLQLFHQDGTGIVSALELHRGFKKLQLHVSTSLLEGFMACDSLKTGVSFGSLLKRIERVCGDNIIIEGTRSEHLLTRILRARKHGISLTEFFRRFSKTLPGHLTEHEYHEALLDFGLELSLSEARDFVSRAGLTSDGAIDSRKLADYLVSEAMSSASLASYFRHFLWKEKAKRNSFLDLFELFDKRRMGELDFKIFSRGLEEIGIILSKNEAQILFKAIDCYDNGKIFIEDLADFLLSRDNKHDSDYVSGSSWESKVRNKVQQIRKKGVNLGRYFQLFVAGNNAMLRTEEFRLQFIDLECDLSEKELQLLLETISQGEIEFSYDNFLNFLFSPERRSQLGNTISSVNGFPPSNNGPLSKKSDAVVHQLAVSLRHARANGADVTKALRCGERFNAKTDYTAEELSSGLENVGVHMNVKDFQDLLEFLGTDEEGFINKNKLNAFVKESVKSMAESSLSEFIEARAVRLQEEFVKLDCKQRGVLSAKCFETVLHMQGWPKPIQIDELRQMGILNDDGAVNYTDIGCVSLRRKLRTAVRRAISKGDNVQDMLWSAARRRAGVLSIDSIRKFVSALGFSLSDSDSNAKPYRSRRGNNRQLEKVNELRRTRLIRQDMEGAFDDILQKDNASEAKTNSEQFISHERELDIVRRFREGKKHDIFCNMLESVVTRDIKIEATSGKSAYFEVSVSNPFPHEETFRISFDCPELRCITSVDEWRYFRDNIDPVWQDPYAKKTSVENEMITQSSLQLTLNAQETVSVPFSFLSYSTGDTESNDSEFLITVLSANYGHSILRIKLFANVYPSVVDRVIHIVAAENELLKASIKMYGENGIEDSLYAHCVDENCSVRRERNTIFLKRRNPLMKTSETLKPELIRLFLYENMFRGEVVAVWELCVQHMKRLDFHGVLGQSCVKDLILRGDHFSRRVQCFSSFPIEVQCSPNEPFQLMALALNKVEVIHRPIRQVSPDLTKQVVLHAVDVDSNELVSACLVNTTVAVPEISKTLEVNLPLREPSHKKIAYVNPWNDSRTFLISTSDPDEVRAKQKSLTIAPKSKEYIRLWFAPKNRPVTQDTLLFINDADDQNEECLLVRARFSDEMNIGS